MLCLYSKNTITGNLVYVFPWAQLNVVTFNFYWEGNYWFSAFSLGGTNTQIVNIHIFKIIPAVYERQFILMQQIERVMKCLLSSSICLTAFPHEISRSNTPVSWWYLLCVCAYMITKIVICRSSSNFLVVFLNKITVLFLDSCGLQR